MNIYDKNKSNITLIEKIGDGWSSSVYKCKIDNKYGIYKLEKTKNINNKYDSSNYYRQIDFSVCVGNKYPDMFLTLIQSGVIYDCNLYMKIPDNMPSYLKKEKANSNKLKTCTYLLYIPILDGTLRSIINKLSNIEYKDMVRQIIKIISVIHKHGYTHNDIHDENIMYKKTKNKYKWYIIDYGLVHHKKYLPNDTDKLVSKKNFKNDKVAFIYSILNNPIMDLIELKNIEINDFEDRIIYIKKQKEHNIINAWIVNNLKHNINKKDINEIIIILSIILYNKIFIESLGLAYVEYKEYDKPQRDRRFLLNLIKKLI